MAADFSIELVDVSKRFGRQWILKHHGEKFCAGSIFGLRGRNGSGKSTYLRLLAGQLSPSRGRVIHRRGEQVITDDELYRLISWTGPYLEIIEELTVSEMLDFHFTFKPTLAGIDAKTIVDRIDLRPAADRPLSNCSSGMRQRVLLATALYADTPFLLFDEPTLTLDVASAEWFCREIELHSNDRVVIIASNDERDLRACQQIVTL